MTASRGTLRSDIIKLAASLLRRNNAQDSRIYVQPRRMYAWGCLRVRSWSANKSRILNILAVTGPCMQLFSAWLNGFHGLKDSDTIAKVEEVVGFITTLCSYRGY